MSGASAASASRKGHTAKRAAGSGRGKEMSNWDWLAKAAIACWAISIAGKLLIMVAGEMSLIRRPNFVGIFDLTGLVSSGCAHCFTDSPLDLSALRKGELGLC